MPHVGRGTSSASSARSLPGARRGICRALGLAVLLLGLCGPAHAAVERQFGPPPWRLGGHSGFSLDAAAFPDSSGYHLEVYVRVPPATLRALSLDSTGHAQLKATVAVKSKGGKGERLESAQEFSTVAGDTIQGQGCVLLFRFPVAPGNCRIEARMEDLLSNRPGIAYGKASRTQRAELRGELEVPKPQAGRDVSDVEFIWPVAGSRPGAAFVRDGRARVPNPDRLYGLYASTLEAAFTARSKAGDDRPWRWVLRVLDAKGTILAQAESTAVGGRFVNGGARFDLADQPAGLYELDARVWQEGDAGSLRRRAKFSVGWAPETWNRNAADIADEVHFLLEAEEEDRWATVQPGEQEVMLDKFWRMRDPTPETAVNEAYFSFRERVEYANAMYSNLGIAKGMFSDMGRVYIRYGEPFEVHKQVIPAGDFTLNRVLVEIMRTEERAVGDVNEKGPGGDQRPYEVWIYEGDISPPFDADPSKTTSTGFIAKRRLVFLFVDEQGLGTYTLRYSTE